jgi:hypothetical protein
VSRNRDLGIEVNRWGYRLDPDEPAYPCGLMAMSMFNDTFTIIDSNGKQVNLIETGIAWPLDVLNKYKNLPISDFRRYQWMDVENGSILKRIK